MSASTPLRMPTLFIPHGGGPCFFMKPGDGFAPGMWDAMGDYLRGIGAQVGARPRAILVISAHWEEAEPTLYAPAQPHLLYDYYGFPDYTYQIEYPAPADAALASRVEELLAAVGLPCRCDEARGFDHGVFIPLKLIYPQADISVVQLSLLNGLDPARHLALGAALAPLREEGVLIIGSGLSYHNMQGLAAPTGGTASQRFDAWLVDAVTQPDVSERARRLKDWAQAPDARHCHPRAEHLLPLFVAAGAAAQDRGRCSWSGEVSDKRNSGFQFG